MSFARSNTSASHVSTPVEDCPQAKPSQSELISLVAQTIATLTARGLPAQDLEMLFRLQDALRDLSPSAQDGTRDNRRGQPASEVLLARASAIVDLFIFAGASPEQAAQTVSRQLTASEVSVPEEGGDARAWKRLLNFRARLLHGSQSRHAQARQEYERLKQELTEIAPEHRVQQALQQHLWDRRQAVHEGPR